MNQKKNENLEKKINNLLFLFFLINLYTINPQTPFLQLQRKHFFYQSFASD